MPGSQADGLDRFFLMLKGLRQPFRLPRKFVSVGHISSMSLVMVVMYDTHSM